MAPVGCQTGSAGRSIRWRPWKLDRWSSAVPEGPERSEGREGTGPDQSLVCVWKLHHIDRLGRRVLEPHRNPDAGRTWPPKAASGSGHWSGPRYAPVPSERQAQARSDPRLGPKLSASQAPRICRFPKRPSVHPALVGSRDAPSWPTPRILSVPDTPSASLWPRSCTFQNREPTPCRAQVCTASYGRVWRWRKHCWPHGRLSFQSGPLLFLQTGSLDYSFLTTSPFSEKRQTLLWLLFFTSFAVKVPMVPVHSHC